MAFALTRPRAGIVRARARRALMEAGRGHPANEVRQSRRFRRYSALGQSATGEAPARRAALWTEIEPDDAPRPKNPLRHAPLPNADPRGPACAGCLSKPVYRCGGRPFRPINPMIVAAAFPSSVFNARLCRNAAGCARWAFVVLNHGPPPGAPYLPWLERQVMICPISHATHRNGIK